LQIVSGVLKMTAIRNYFGGTLYDCVLRQTG